MLTITSTGPSSQSLTPSESPQSQASTGGVAFFHNKPAMIATFASAGIFALVVAFILLTVLVRRKRRRDLLLDSAIDFSPTMDHLISMDNESKGGGSTNALLSRSSGSLSSETRGTRPRVPSIVFGAGPNASIPALTPAPLSVPASVAAPREMQQRGPGTGFIGDRRLDRGDTLGSRYPYGNSAQPYYDTVRQQPPLQSRQQQQQQQQLQYQPQLQQSRSLRWQRQEERRPPSDLPTDVNPIPASLMPSYQRDPAGFNAPFATMGTKPSQSNVDGGVAGGTWISRTTSKRERRRTQQVPLPPPVSFPRKIPDMLGRNDGDTEGTSASVDEDPRNRPRILKVRRFCLLLSLPVADWGTCMCMAGHERVTFFVTRHADRMLSSYPLMCARFCYSNACWACVRRYE